jgi:hypothetical protein
MSEQQQQQQQQLEIYKELVKQWKIDLVEKIRDLERRCSDANLDTIEKVKKDNKNQHKFFLVV